MRNTRFFWWSGRIVRDRLVGFFSPTLTVKDPQIPHLPLESPTGEQHSGSASISGIGLLLAVGFAAMLGITSLFGNGAQITIGQKAALSMAAISGGGSQVASGKKSAIVSASVSGNGSLIATGEKFEGEQYSGIAAISGRGTLIFEGIKNGKDSILISETGFLVGFGEKRTSGDSSITGGGSLLAEGFQSELHSGVGVISGSGYVNTSGNKNAKETVTLHIESGEAEVPELILSSDGKLLKRISSTFYVRL